jgi:hypothetical protein
LGLDLVVALFDQCGCGALEFVGRRRPRQRTAGVSRHTVASATVNNTVVTGLPTLIPYSAEQGIILEEQGICAREQGILLGGIEAIGKRRALAEIC